jgi:phospho-N-acetylmuramoyl-pentapeptide-transferase
MQVGQVLREEGPQSHLHKAKTPTAGGVSFIVSTILGSAIFAAVSASHMPGVAIDIIVVLLVATSCAALGLADDLAKVVQKSNKGLSESIRLKIETVVGILFGTYLVWHDGGVLKVWVPMIGAANSGGLGLEPHSIPAIFAVLLVAFLVVATANSANMHDGMDGLAAGTSFLIFCTMGIMLVLLAPHAPHLLGLGAVSFAAAASMLGFFCFNRHPAKIFMGDTGSLFIGGLMATLAASGGLILWFIPLSVIYILESASVLIQRAVFKLSKPFTPDKPMSPLQLVKYKLTRKLPGEGTRVFRIAPLHHHYEAVFAEKGVQEAQVVAAFWVVQALICALVLLAFNSTFNSTSTLTTALFYILPLLLGGPLLFKTARASGSVFNAIFRKS